MLEVQAEDLLRFGLIPEFVGRLPVTATLGQLDQDALIQILTQPKNALVKQYQRLFEFSDVQLRFTDNALVAVAKEALARKSGARGLRAILENAMLNIMYEAPSHSAVNSRNGPVGSSETNACPARTASSTPASSNAP